MNKGKVWLIGAGPSDIGLFTLKGKEVLEQAEVVIYDRLAGQAVLSLMPKNAEKIDAGKTSSNHTIPQNRINEIILQKAIEGKRVVRLKGGDPFLFGRGGEELELLVENNIPFEIVPGVTSAFAVPAYNGIPVTHREYCSSVHIIAAHGKEGREEIDYKSLVNLNGTIIFLMGVSSLEKICDSLLEAGMDKDMPASILEKGTTARQRNVISTIENLSKKARESEIKTPAIIIVGKVCKLGESLSWYDKLPLSGIRVGVTRPANRISSLSYKLRELGAEVLEIPTISTIAIEENEKLKNALNHIEDYEYLAFTSPSGVDIFFEQLRKLHIDIRKLGKIKIASIGKGTERELEERGIYSNIVPKIYDANNFAIELINACKVGEKILLPRAEKGNPKLVNDIEKNGIKVDDISLYKTLYEEVSTINIDREFKEIGVDYLMFTSASTVDGFVTGVKDIDYSMIKAICIGEKTSTCAKSYGMQVITAKEASINSLIEALVKRVKILKH